MEEILITGVSGEVGYTLLKRLKSEGKDVKITAIDLKTPAPEISSLIDKFIEVDITSKDKITEVIMAGNFDILFHLASILSTGGEKNPELALDVNIGGTINLLEASTKSCLLNNKSIKFIFPSSIAAYGNPITSYGIAKRACENLGVYFSQHYKLLDSEINRNYLIDFRCVRFPGLLSPDTLPTGGTSDYGPEMLHAAAKGESYECFVRPDTKIPFMAMVDAIDNLILLKNTPKNKLTKQIYDLSGFSVSAKDIEEKIMKFFPSLSVNYKVDENRQKIVDSWPSEVESLEAKNDWGYKIAYDFEKAFSEYLIPAVSNRYK